MKLLKNLRTALLKPKILVQYIYFQLRIHIFGSPPSLPMPNGLRLHPAERFNDYRSVYVQRPEEAELRLLKELLLRPDSIVVDVGANVGAFTLLASATGMVARVIAFEPAHRYCQAFHKNMDMNGIRGISLVQAAASDTAGVANFRADPALPLHGKFDVGLLYSSKVISSVSTVRLDEFLPIIGITNVDLLKIDVEGAEPCVIRGAQALLRKRAIYALYLEFIVEHIEDMGENPQEFVDVIAESGYSFYAISPDGSVGPTLDPNTLVADRRVTPGTPNRAWFEINLLALRSGE